MLLAIFTNETPLPTELASRPNTQKQVEHQSKWEWHKRESDTWGGLESKSKGHDSNCDQANQRQHPQQGYHYRERCSPTNKPCLKMRHTPVPALPP